MSPLDQPLDVTVFRDVWAKSAERRKLTLRDLAETARTATAPAKSDLELVKLATFGDRRTDKNSLRHTANMLEVFGIEIDYDAKKVSPAEAVARLEAAGVAALVYTSPSHTAAAPKWRVLAPLSGRVSPAERETFAARLNTLLGGVASRESFTASQSFYIGRTAAATDHRVVEVDGRFLDDLDGINPTYPPRKAGKTIELPRRDPDQPDSEFVASAVRAALAAFDEPDAAGQCHPVILEVTRALAPFVAGGALDGAEAVDMIRQRMPREPNTNEIESALAGALATARPYIYADGSEFGTLPPMPRAALLRRLMHPADCITSVSRGYIVKHILAPGDVGALIGPPSAGKSVVAPHIAYAVAQGREVFGLRTKPGRVLYAAAEDASGMRQRVRALYQRHGDAPDFATVDLGNLRDPATAADLRDAVGEWKPALVVLDTLGAAWAGLDENSSVDMGEVVKLSRELAATGAAVLLVHHIAKHGDGSPRGHSVLNGTLDMCLALGDRADDGTIRAKLLKNRNGTPNRELAFRIDVADLGMDEDGDAITAPVAAEVGRPAATGPKLSRQQAIAWGEFVKLEAETTPDETRRTKISLRDWRDACDMAALSASEDRGIRRNTFNRRVGELYRLGLIVKTDDCAWRVAYSDHSEASEAERGEIEAASGARRGERGEHPRGVRFASPQSNDGSEFVQ